ncbi:hypothetical protein [Neokomagataea anthophila]|uniref:Uncharacterized protein n=1 Tax=Neokomagataea anthophila TaxID=2826925 RepID=A0ABS5E580_9PROT|nr:hypothetical protein [Neokomagataea anthophila]MBR0559069.1 hypothetical protein [Neokomagataea anthophila]
MSTHRPDSGSPQLDPRETKILSDILALVLDEQSGTSENALNALKQRATRSNITGGALKNLFTHLIHTVGDPPHTQRHITQLTQRLQKADENMYRTARQNEALRTALHNAKQENTHLRHALSDKSSPFAWPKTTLIVTALFGLLLGIAGAEIIHTLTATPIHPRPLYFR